MKSATKRQRRTTDRRRERKHQGEGQCDGSLVDEDTVEQAVSMKAEELAEGENKENGLSRSYTNIIGKEVRENDAHSICSISIIS